MRKVKILITGGCGYVGSRLVDALYKKGFEISVIDKVSPTKKSLNFPKSIIFFHGDLRNKNVVSKSLIGIDYVVHLAANIGPLTYMKNHQAEILQENSAIDSVLYPAMVKAKIKAVLYSSSSMVFQKSPVLPYKEEDINKINPPTNVYGFSKLVGEYFCKSFHEEFGLNYVIMRYHNIYGIREEGKGLTAGDIHVIPALIKKVLDGQYPLEIIGNPEASRPFTYIDDAVNATVRLVEETVKKNSKVLNEDFNIGPRESTKIIDLAKLIWKTLGDGRTFKYKVVANNSITSDRREMNPAKIEKATHWKPSVGLSRGIKILADND